MLARDTRVAIQIERQDPQDIIYQASLFTLLEVKRKLQIMVQNGEINLTTVELDRSLGISLQKLTTLLNKQIQAADLWQTKNKCPQCQLRLVPLMETCVCGCKTNIKGENLDVDDFNFLIAENCTE